MKKLIFIALLAVCTFVSTEAQNATQALRFSQYNPFGTARFAAQGGAIGALGGDFSSVISNPAGVGFYRSSELSFTPSIYWVNTVTNFMGNSIEDSQTKFNIGSLGFSQGFPQDKSGIAGFAYSLGYSSLANFNNRSTLQGINTNSSLLDDFTWHANETVDPITGANHDDLNPFYEGLAFDSNLMPYDSVAGRYWHDMQLDGYGQEVYRNSEQSGYIGEYSISGAVNFSNFIYIGATFGIHAVRFYEDIYHTETDANDQVLDFNSFRFREFNSTKGWGYTGRFGMIIRPFHLLRVGATFHLPTYYNLTDEKYTDMSSTWDNGSGISDASASSPNGVYDYKLQTPFRANVNASLILFKIATVSLGYGYVDYSTSRLDAYDYKFIDENQQIKQDLQASQSANAGAEIRIQSLYLRAGAKYMTSPFINEENNAETLEYSAGIGFRTKQIVFDVSYSYATRTDIYGIYAFEPGSNEVSINDLSSNNLMFTIGYKF
ncbi:MAG: hypothetical protein DRI97_07765 [Bacteroidetes bacterium]|nr:MAG: hypothetical protein DRI97_07765 [Bacteroidota bacterium]